MLNEAKLNGNRACFHTYHTQIVWKVKVRFRNGQILDFVWFPINESFKKKFFMNLYVCLWGFLPYQSNMWSREKKKVEVHFSMLCPENAFLNFTCGIMGIRYDQLWKIKPHALNVERNESFEKIRCVEIKMWKKKHMRKNVWIIPCEIICVDFLEVNGATVSPLAFLICKKFPCDHFSFKIMKHYRK